MKLTNIGGATAILEHKGKRVLFDPWMDEGIFYGSWYHYPPLKMSIADLGHIDYIFISHIHEDHCSAATMKHINRDAEVIMMNRKPNYVINYLRSHDLKFKHVHLINERTPTEIIPGLTVDMLTDDPTHEMNYLINSALVLNWDGFTLYNANDCHPYPGGLDYLLSRYKKIDAALIPYTGGSGYPACYKNLSDQEKYDAAKSIQAKLTSEFIKTYEILKPTWIMPFADQYAVGGSRAYLNKFLVHPPSPGAVYEPMKQKGYDKNLLLLNSGQTFDFDSKEKTSNEPYYTHTEADRDEYVAKNLQQFKYEHEKIDVNSAVAFDRLLKAGRNRLWLEQEKENYFPNYRYYFDVQDKKRLFKIDLAKKDVEEVPYDAVREQPYITMTCSHSLFVLMVIGHMSWNMADAALFIDYVREPNIYDPKIYAYINFIKA